MKAVLVIDTPKNCSECKLSFLQGIGESICNAVDWEERPSWCPLRPVHALKSGGHDYIIYERQYLYDNLEREFELLQKTRDWEKQNDSN